MHLFTKEIDNKLFKQYPMGDDLDNQVVVAKIYNPYGRGTWYLLNSDPEDPDYIWAIVDLFDVEAGSVSRSELEELRVPPFNLGLERDLYFAPISAKKLYEGLQKGQQFAEGGETDTTILEDKNGYAWLFPENPDGKDFGIKLADGGETKDDYTKHFTKYLTDKFKGKNYKGWVFSYDSFVGTVSWTRNNIELMATPFYEGESILPIDMVNAENGDPLYQDSLEFKPSNNLEKDEAKYFELLKPFFMVLDVIVEDNEEEQYMADGGMSNSMEEMYKQMENRNMTIRFKIASIIGVHKALEYLEKDYVISPYKLIQGAVGKGLITIDEIDENLWNEAVSEADDVDSYYRGSGEGIGSSDMNAFISNMLNGAGIKVGVVDNRYQRMADGGMMAKGGGVYSSDSLYYLQVLKDGEEVAKEKFRAKSLKDAKTISEEEYEEKYISKFGNPLNFIVSEAMADGGMMGKGGNLDAKYTPDDVYKYAVERKYIIGFQGREDILYFKSKEEANNYVKEKPSMRKYLGTIMAHGSMMADGGMMAKGGEVNYLKKWRVKGINMQGKMFKKEITLGRMSDKNDVKYALKRMPDTNIREVTLIEEIKEDGGMMAKGGMTKKSTFDQKVKSISKSLQGAKVKPKYVSKYGKTYDKAESVEAAKNIAGSIRAKYGE
jgi:hypothetical protein